jgi:hypothetical protein
MAYYQRGGPRAPGVHGIRAVREAARRAAGQTPGEVQALTEVELAAAARVTQARVHGMRPVFGPGGDEAAVPTGMLESPSNFVERFGVYDASERQLREQRLRGEQDILQPTSVSGASESSLTELVCFLKGKLTKAMLPTNSDGLTPGGHTVKLEGSALIIKRVRYMTAKIEKYKKNSSKDLLGQALIRLGEKLALEEDVGDKRAVLAGIAKVYCLHDHLRKMVTPNGEF